MKPRSELDQLLRKRFDISPEDFVAILRTLPAVHPWAATLTEGQDMPDEVRARLLLARGRTQLATDTETAPLSADAVAQAIEDLRTAIQLHDSCGGKEDLKRAERLQKKFDASQSND